MQRRSFLKKGSLASFALSSIASLSYAGTSIGHHNDINTTQFSGTFELSEATISDLQHKMQTRQLTSRAITALYLKRIAEIDKAGPRLNAVIELNNDALSIADAMDKER